MCCACFRDFRLLLRPDHTLFSPDAVFESSSGRQLHFDPGKVYMGALEGEFSIVMHAVRILSSVRTVAGCKLDEQASISGRDRGFSLHHTALGLTRPVFPEVMRLKHDADLHLVLRLTMRRASSLCLHGVVITSRVT